MITIVLADDEKLIRAGLKKSLQTRLQFRLKFLKQKTDRKPLNSVVRKSPRY
jgi:DNA-binding NarL/FixJ family response regulator